VSSCSFRSEWSLLLLLSAGSCAPTSQPESAPQSAPAHRPAALAQPTPLVLQVDEGERRMRRVGFSAPGFTIKVDSRNGGSSELMMGYEALPAAAIIPPHYHRTADEIILVYRGSGIAQLGGRKAAFGPGATIYIPRNTRVTLENTGADSLDIAFIFSRPGFEHWLREISTPEGQPLPPLSAAELTAIRKRHEWHTVFERP
jgi:quercetin dioxygenase-like cupin family protein